MKEDNKDLICEENCIHKNKIDSVKLTEIGLDDVIDLADIFKLFSDSTRLRIICTLLNEELCVCDIAELLNLNQSTVSHQLRILRDNKLVKYRREGKQIFYTLKDSHIEQIILQAYDHRREEK